MDYTIGVTPGLTALTYKDGPNVKTFKTNEVTTDHTALGSLVTVLLVRTIDTGGERFGFFLPQLDLPPGQTTNFATAGVYERFSGPNSIPHRLPNWRCIEMDGTARTVVVPLEQHPTA